MKVAWIVRKDLMRFGADRTGAIMSLLLPVMLASLLSLLLAPRLDPNPTVSALIINLDGGPASAELIGRLQQTDLALEPVDTINEARARIRDGDATLAIVLPKDIGDALSFEGLQRAQPAQIQLLFEPSPGPEPRIAEGALMRVSMDQLFASFQRLDSRDALVRFLVADDTPDADTPLRPPLEVAHTAVVGPDDMTAFDIHAHSFAGMLCMFLLFMAMEQARQLLSERATGTLGRAQLSSVSRRQVFIGTALSTAALALVLSALVYITAYLLFDVRVRGSIPGFALILLAQAAFAGGFALFLAGVGRTERQLVNLGTALILLLSFAGGAWFPASLMPPWLRLFAHALPSYWATQGLAAMTWRGQPFGDALLPAVCLVSMGGLCALLGAWRFRWR